MCDSRLTIGNWSRLGVGILLFALSAAAVAQRFDLDWAVSTGGPQEERFSGAVTDASGNVYDSGRFETTIDFDPGLNVFELPTNTLFSDVYVRKLDASGNFVYAVSITADIRILGGLISVDDVGNVTVVGRYRGSLDFNPGDGVFELTCGTAECVYELGLDPMGQLMFARSLDASGVGGDRQLDSSNNLLIAGRFNGTIDFDPGPGVFELTSVADEPFETDGFVLKLDASGNFVWARAILGLDNDVRFDFSNLAIDSSDAVYVAGEFGGVTTSGVSVDFDPGSGVTALAATGLGSGFLLKLDASGNFVFARVNEGMGSDTPRGIAVDSNGAIYTVGFFSTGGDGVDFDPGPGTAIRTTVGPAVSSKTDIYIQKLNSSGEFVSVITLGGPDNDAAGSCLVDASDNLYITGSFEGSVDFDPGPGQRTFTGLELFGAFFLVLDSDGALISADAFNAAATVSSGPEVGFVSVHPVLGAEGAVILAGEFRGRADFDPGPGVFELSSTPFAIVGQILKDVVVLSLSPNRRINSVPSSGFVVEGDRVELRGPLGSNFQWTKDFVDLVNDPPRVVGVNTAMLVIDPVALSDSGVYRVGYDNGLKAITTSEPFALTVLPVGSLPSAGVWALLVAMGIIAAMGVTYFVRR